MPADPMLCLQVEAMNELGDVYAHFGSWREAVQAWNDALDCLIGPYQVNGVLANQNVTFKLPGIVIGSDICNACNACI